MLRRRFACIAAFTILLGACQGEIQTSAPPVPSQSPSPPPSAPSPSPSATTQPTVTAVPTATRVACVSPATQSFECFSTSLKAALNGRYCSQSRDLLSQFFAEWVRLQFCGWAGCPYDSLMTSYAAAADQLCSYRQPQDANGMPIPVQMQFVVYENDVSVFPARPEAAKHVVVSSAPDGTWAVYLGFDYVGDRYFITDLLVQENGAPPTPLPTQDLYVPFTTYHDPDGVFSIQYPSNWTADAEYPSYLSVEVDDGSNLFLKEMHATWWGADRPCNKPAAGGIEATAPPERVIVNGIRFTKDEGGDQGMNQVHELTSYSTVHGDACVNITFTLNWTKPGVYDIEPRDFDREAEHKLFERILATLKFGP